MALYLHYMLFAKRPHVAEQNSVNSKSVAMLLLLLVHLPIANFKMYQSCACIGSNQFAHLFFQELRGLNY